jgi:molybdenum cofactor guanylyltransferase
VTHLGGGRDRTSPTRPTGSAGTASASTGVEPVAARADEHARDAGAEPSSTSVSGLVLCGGRSLRMGSDKARLSVDGRTLLERAIGVLAPLCANRGEVWLACGPHERYAELGARLCPDRTPDGGPLAGIEAGLSAAAPGWVCVLAVDMPRARSAHFESLLARARGGALDAVLARSASGDEPLLGVYHTRVLGAVRRALELGERRVTSFLRHPLGAPSAAPLDAPNGAPSGAGHAARVAWETALERADDGFAANLNTPDDLERELARSTRTPGKRSP